MPMKQKKRKFFGRVRRIEIPKLGKLKYRVSESIAVPRTPWPLKKLAKNCGLRRINKKILSQHTEPAENTDIWEYQFLKFKSKLSGSEVAKIAAALGYELANLREVLDCFFKLSKKMRRRILKCDIIALGSPLKGPGREKHLPFINSARELRVSHGTQLTQKDTLLVKKKVILQTEPTQALP